MTTRTSEELSEFTYAKRHPFRGLLWGIMMGIGLTVVLVATKVIRLELWMMIAVTVVSIVIGVVWGLAGPAKPVKGVPPAHLRRATEPPPASRFDDFDDPEKASGPMATAETATDADADQTSDPAADDD